MFSFYAAISKLQGEGVENIIVDMVREGTLHGNNHLILYILHCVCEAKTDSLCYLVASILYKGLNLAGTFLNALDCHSLGYFLSLLVPMPQHLAFGVHTDCTICSKVNLANCGLDDYKLDFLTKELSEWKHRSLKGLGMWQLVNGKYRSLDLDLQRNFNIHGRGIRLLSELIRNNPTLIESLHLGSNKIQVGEDGLMYLLQALRTNPIITFLNLWSCSLTITEETGKELMSMLQENTTLRCLELGYNAISDVGIHYVVQGMRHNTTLKRLGLGYSEGKEGSKLIARMITKNEHLQFLDVRCIAGREAILESVKTANETRKQHGIVELKVM